MKKANIIALLQQKGGSGKTTTAMNIAGGLRELGFHVLVVDMDKDKPDAWSWAAKSEEFADSVIQVDEKNAREALSGVREKADFVIIDTPPNFQTAALKAALLSDLVVIPAAPSGMDLSGLLEAKDLALTADRPYKLLANRVLKNSNMSRSLLNVLEEEGQAFSTYIPQSVKFVEAEATGQYIGEYAPESYVHIQVRKLSKEIVALFEKASV
ncbi:ParA family protein [Fangia hongkongensis]|uniref:ParA family protein n=1 Tax=Fangia hongkongensis TaxID=270495 RepID=UPI00037604BA|nr:ParA family protein [Fangia hongkongensis]MBK2125641.1 ParA family protein [Fangia hongkongensis]